MGRATTGIRVPGGVALAVEAVLAAPDTDWRRVPLCEPRILLPQPLYPPSMLLMCHVCASLHLIPVRRVSSDSVHCGPGAGVQGELSQG